MSLVVHIAADDPVAGTEMQGFNTDAKKEGKRLRMKPLFMRF